MEEIKKEEVKQEQVQDTPVKKKSNTVLFVVIGVVVFFVILSVAAFFIVRGLLRAGVDKLNESTGIVEEITNDISVTEDGQDLTYKVSTEQKVDGTLEKDNLLTKNFPEDIPLSGGVVTASSYDEYEISTSIDTASTVEETLAWYVAALQTHGWEINSQSSEEAMEGWKTASIDFASNDGLRTGNVSIETTPYHTVSLVTVREIL